MTGSDLTSMKERLVRTFARAAAAKGRDAGAAPPPSGPTPRAPAVLFGGALFGAAVRPPGAPGVDPEDGGAAGSTGGEGGAPGFDLRA